MPADPLALRRFDELDGKTHLICVGATKCATSWLHGYLGGLPEVAVSPLKELHFFNAKFPQNALSDMEALSLARLRFHMAQAEDMADALKQRPAFQASVDRVQMIYDDNAYFGHFVRLCSARTRVFCDITPAYSAMGQEAFNYIKAFCAAQAVQLKLLFVMRDPVARLWSQLRHLQQMNPENDTLAKWPEAIQSPGIRARGDYRATVTALDTSFPAADVLYMFYEDLFSDASLGKLCDFCGVEPGPADFDKRRNQTTVKQPLPEDARAALAQMLAPQYDFCRARFGDLVPADWQGNP